MTTNLPYLVVVEARRGLEPIKVTVDIPSMAEGYSTAYALVNESVVCIDLSSLENLPTMAVAPVSLLVCHDFPLVSNAWRAFGAAL